MWMKRYALTIHTGFVCEEHDNPADFFLDVVTQCEDENTNSNGVLHNYQSCMTPQYVYSSSPML